MSQPQKIRVNPAIKNETEMVVYDHRNRRILSKPAGTEVPSIAFYNRLLKDGDLVVVTPQAKTVDKSDKPAGGSK